MSATQVAAQQLAQAIARFRLAERSATTSIRTLDTLFARIRNA